jgi:hypothetical protein
MSEKQISAYGKLLLFVLLLTGSATTCLAQSLYDTHEDGPVNVVGRFGNLVSSCVRVGYASLRHLGKPSLTIHPFGVDTPHVSVLRAGPHTTSMGSRGPMT